MPNWAFGIVEVSGTKTEIESFIGRFISDDDHQNAGSCQHCDAGDDSGGQRGGDSLHGVF